MKVIGFCGTANFSDMAKGKKVIYALLKKHGAFSFLSSGKPGAALSMENIAWTLGLRPERANLSQQLKVVDGFVVLGEPEIQDLALVQRAQKKGIPVWFVQVGKAQALSA